jgi:hypothetical protein
LDLRQKILRATDCAICALIVVLVLGSTLSFGGAVWWFRPVLAITAFMLVAVELSRHLLAGQVRILKSPLTLLGMLALALAVGQLVPLPAGLASRVSPTAHEAYSRGFFPDLVHADDPEASLPEAPSVRSPASLDRSATLRWLVGASACLGIFWAVSHFTDRLGRLYLVWGLVVAGFLLNAAMAFVQLTNHCDGLYGLLQPGQGPSWAPTLDDLMETPTTTTLRALSDSATPSASQPRVQPGVVLNPIRPSLYGTLMGGSGSILALGAMAMPLALAIVLHLVSPRGSRESLANRLGDSSQGSLVTLLVSLTLLGAFVIGLIAGAWYCLPVVLGLAAVGFPALRRPGSRWPALGLTAGLLTSMGLGVALQASWSLLLGGQAPVEPQDLGSAQALWSDSIKMLREFPLVGVGLGSFGTIQPYFKESDMASTTAMSSLLQWGAETGVVGLGLVALAGLWCVIRLPAGLKRVGTVDRSLAHGLIGAALSFSLLSVVHWTFELSAVAISASALGGTWNRWLAGGTDLFVERG